LIKTMIVGGFWPFELSYSRVRTGTYEGDRVATMAWPLRERARVRSARCSGRVQYLGTASFFAAVGRKNKKTPHRIVGGGTKGCAVGRARLGEFARTKGEI